MKANELMLFDIVRRVRDKKPITVTCLEYSETISGIAPDDVYYGDQEDYHESELEPIPLTPEILEKNGFENDFYEDESVADYVKVRLEGYSLRCKANGWDDALVTWCNGHLEVVTDFNGEVRKDIDHVHQLQHALRICGIDKEIVL